jgi:hypothetical protein
MHRAAALLVFILLNVGAWASDTPADRATLRGLKALQVAVDPTGPELESQGLRAEDLQARIQDRLRRANIPVDAAAPEFVGLHVMAAHEGKGPYAVCFSLGLYQSVSLDRDKSIRTATQTWETQSVVLAPARQLHNAMDSTLNQLVDQFIAAYAASNPQ